MILLACVDAKAGFQLDGEKVASVVYLSPPPWVPSAVVESDMGWKFAVALPRLKMYVWPAVSDKDACDKQRES